MGDPKQVKAVIKSIRDYSNFRQMAEYNISCLLTYITPPTVGYRENVAAAVEDGGIESIIAVLAKHGNALDMVKQATTALSLVATTKENAGRVAKNGGIETAIQCLMKVKPGPDQEDVIKAGAKLLTNIARHNPKSIIQQPHAVRAMLDGVNHSQAPLVQAASAKVLDKISVFPEGQQVIVAQGGIGALIQAIAPGKPTDVAMLLPVLQILERLAKDPANVQEMKKHKALEALAAQLAAHAGNEYVERVGGRLVARIAGGEIVDTIRQLNGNLADNMREHFVNLLAAFALEPGNIEKIVKNGGIEALLNNFHKYNPRTKASALRALQKIAASGAANANKIIEAGGLPIIIGAIKDANGNEDVLKAATQALTSIIACGLEQANLIHQAGGIKAVLDQMMQNPHLEGFTASALEMIEKLCSVGFPTDKLLAMNVVDAIFASMHAGLKNPEVQEKGFQALSALLSTADDKANAMAATAIGSNKSLNVLAQSLLTHREEREVVKAGVETYARLGHSQAPALKGSGGLEALTEAVYAQMKLEMLGQGGLLADLAYTRNVKGLLNKLVDKRALGQVPSAVAGGGNEEALKQAAVYALNGDFAATMQNAGIAKALTASVSRTPPGLVPEHAVATWSLAKSSLEAMGTLIDSGCVKALLTSAKTNSKNAPAVTAVLRSLIPFVTSKDFKAKMITLGVIESAITGMRSNAQSAVVSLAAVELLLALASTDEAASTVCFKGGVRQVNKMIKESSSSAEFEKPVERALHLLYRIASVDNTEVKNQLSGQDTVNTVTTAMSAYPTNSEILEVGAKILSLLMTEEDVMHAIDEIVRLTAELKASRKPDKVFEKLGQKAATVGFVSLNPKYKEIYMKKDAANVVDKAIATSKTKPLNNKREIAVMNEYRALGQISSMLNPERGIIDKFLKDLQSSDEQTSLLEKVGILEGIKYLCNNPQALNELQSKGAVGIITELLAINRSDEQFLQAALDALSALMSNKKGVDLATAAGTGDLISGILKNDGDHISSKAATSALLGLEKFARDPKNTQRLLEDGIVDTVTSTIGQQCEKSEVPRPGVVSAAAKLLKMIVENDGPGEASDQVVKKGAIKKIMDVCQSSPVYLADDDCMQNVTELLELLANNEELLPKLRDLGAVEFVMAAMNMNPGNEALEHCGQRVLQKLVGGDASALEQTLAEYDRLLNNVKKHPKGNVPALQRLNRAQVNLKNLMMIEGVVDAEGAEKIMNRAIDTYKVVDKIPDSVGPIKEHVLDLALDTVGKTTLVDGAMKTIDLDKALDLLGQAMGNSSPELQVQALKALGVLLAEDRRVVQSAINMGLVQKLQQVLDNSTSPEVTEAAQKALENIREQVMHDPSIIVINSPANDAALAAIIKGINDPNDLENFLQSIGATPEGAAALMRLALSNLGQENADLAPDLRKAVLKALGNLPPGALNLSPSNIKAILDLLGSPDISSAEKTALLKILGDMPLNPANSKIILDNDGIETLLQMLQGTTDPNVLLGALAALGQLSKDPMLANKIFDLNGEEQIVALMRKHKDNMEIQQLGFEALANLKDATGGPKKFELSPDAVMYLEQAVSGLPGDKRRAQQLVDDLSNMYNGEVEPMVLRRFSKMLEILNKAKDWKVLIDPKTGKPYYYNTVTGETTWTKPQALIAAENALKMLEELAKKSPAEIDHDKLRAALGHFKNQTDEPLRLKALAKALAALAANEANRDAMVQNGLLNALIKALSGGNVDREFILAAIALLNRFAKHPQYKEMICKIGGIRALIAIMVKYIKDEEIVEKCEQCLANLAFQSKLCTAEIMTCKGPEAVGHALKNHKDSIPVTLNAMTLLSNLMYKSLENKQKIGDLLTSRIVAVLRRMYKNNDVFRQTGRALGNIAFVDEHIRTIVNLKVVKTLVEALTYHKNDVGVVKLGIDVIGNFASIDEEEYAQQIKQGQFNSVISTIYFEGGARKIVDVFSETNDLSLIASCIKSLMHLLEDADVRRKLIGMGVVQMLFGALQQYSQDQDVTDFCIDSIELLSFSPEGVESIYENDGVSILLQQLDQHVDRADFVLTVTKALVNMSNKREPHKDLSLRVMHDIGQQGGIDTLLNVTEANIDNDQYVKMTIKLFTLMTATRPEVSQEIAQKGMRIILRVVESHENDPKVLISAYQLIGLLAFEPKNLKVIVQYGGINLIVKSILKFPENDALVTRSIKTLDNIAMASEEHSNIVKQAKGKKVIEELIKTYETIPGSKAQSVVKACKAALLSLTKIETRMKAPAFKFTTNREETDPLADPLKNHRELLKTGAEVRFWSKGSSRMVHLFVVDRKMQIQWKVPGGKKVVGKIELKNLTNVSKGVFPSHGKRVSANLAFALKSAKGEKLFCFECAEEADRDRWHNAFDALKNTYRNNNQKYLYL